MSVSYFCHAFIQIENPDHEALRAPASARLFHPMGSVNYHIAMAKSGARRDSNLGETPTITLNYYIPQIDAEQTLKYLFFGYCCDPNQSWTVRNKESTVGLSLQRSSSSLESQGIAKIAKAGSEDWICFSLLRLLQRRLSYHLLARQDFKLDILRRIYFPEQSSSHEHTTKPANHCTLFRCYQPPV